MDEAAANSGLKNAWRWPSTREMRSTEPRRSRWPSTDLNRPNRQKKPSRVPHHPVEAALSRWRRAPAPPALAQRVDLSEMAQISREAQERLRLQQQQRLLDHQEAEYHRQMCLKVGYRGPDVELTAT